MVERDLDPALDVAEERHVRMAQADEVRRERRRGERERAALARAGDGDPVGIDAGQARSGLDRANGVDVEAAVVVASRGRDAARHHAGMLGARPPAPGSGVCPADQVPPCARVSMTKVA